MAEKTCFVVNPQGGNGAAGRRWPEVEKRLPGLFKDVRVSMTQRPMQAAELARKAIDDGYELIVAVGGDGTVHEVINGCMDGDKAVHPGTVLGVLPIGTGGDFRRTLKLPERAEAALDALAIAPTRALDVGRVRFIGHDGQETMRYFANIASFGSSGRISKIANEQTKLLGGKLSFAIASLRGMTGWRDQRVRMVFDGGEPVEMPITTVAVCNGRYFGGGMMVAPGALIDDGTLHVTIWSGFGFVDFITKSARIYDGRHVEFPGTKVLTCKTVRAEPLGEAVMLETDGEAPGRLPATFDILPAALKVKAAA